MGYLEEADITHGWAFYRLDGLRAKVADYRNDIFAKLEQIQQTTTGMIGWDINIWEAYRVYDLGGTFLTHIVGIKTCQSLILRPSAGGQSTGQQGEDSPPGYSGLLLRILQHERGFAEAVPEDLRE